MLEGSLNTAVDRLLEYVKGAGLKKRKFADDDSVVLNNGVELSYGSLKRLRQEEWLDIWMIMAAMQISDKPSFVRYDYSILLDEVVRNGKMRPVWKPLAGWAAK